MTALDSLHTVLAQAADEPADGIAIRTGVGPDMRIVGVTWGELREVGAAAEALFVLRRWLSREICAQDDAAALPTSEYGFVEATMWLQALGSVQRHLDCAR